jgi:hypothetical protein
MRCDDEEEEETSGGGNHQPGGGGGLGEKEGYPSPPAGASLRVHARPLLSHAWPHTPAHTVVVGGTGTGTG